MVGLSADNLVVGSGDQKEVKRYLSVLSRLQRYYYCTQGDIQDTPQQLQPGYFWIVRCWPKYVRSTLTAVLPCSGLGTLPRGRLSVCQGVPNMDIHMIRYCYHNIPLVSQ